MLHTPSGYVNHSQHAQRTHVIEVTMTSMPETPGAAREYSPEQITARLRRIEGQVRGIARMLEDNRSCEDVVTQLMAVRSSIDTVGAAILDAHLCGCVSGQKPEEQVQALREAMRLWWRFAPAAGGVGADPSAAGASSPVPVPPGPEAPR